MEDVFTQNMIKLSNMKEKHFLDFAAIQIWYGTKWGFLKLFAVPSVVLAVPFSRSVSERFFSGVLLIVPENCSLLSCERPEDITVILALVENDWSKKCFWQIDFR